MVDNPYSYPYVPVGGIIEWDGTGLIGAPDLSTPEKVAAVYGYGTWERYGTDRVTVGAGGDYAVGSTGGAWEVVQTVDQMPSHGHSIAGSSATAPNGVWFPAWQAVASSTSGGGGGQYYPVSIMSSGGDKPMPITNKYTACYMYRRTG